MSLLRLLPTTDLAKIFHHFSKTPSIPKKTPSPPAPPATYSSGFIYEPLTHIRRYVSYKHADYFIWELGVFKEGLKVILGDNLVLARITGIVGVGWNFIKFGVETLGSSFRDEIPVNRMIIFLRTFSAFLALNASSVSSFLGFWNWWETLLMWTGSLMGLMRRGREDCQLIMGRLFAICFEV